LIRFTDTHCHLTLPQFDVDRSAVIQRAIDLGLSRLLVPGIDLQSSKESIRLCAMFPGFIYAAVGVHPNSEIDNSKEDVQNLRLMAKQKNIVAIGEIGLDYYRQSNPINEQKNLFNAQLDLAAELGLPVIIHCRESIEDVLNIVEDWTGKNKNRNSLDSIKGVFHSFSGDIITARRIIELGFMLGISGPITYPKNISLAETIREIGINYLLVETDAPYLAPQAMRGKRNLPEYVLYVINKICEIFNLPVEFVCKITSENASRLFKWDK
jgi:TatD DNase family protein